MARKPSQDRRSVADEAVFIAEVRPPRTTVSPTKLEPAHPALEADVDSAVNPTQSAREMNTPADRAGVPYDGSQLGVTPPVDVEIGAVPGFTGAKLLTIAEEAAMRVHDTGEDTASADQ